MKCPQHPLLLRELLLRELLLRELLLRELLLIEYHRQYRLDLLLVLGFVVMLRVSFSFSYYFW